MQLCMYVGKWLNKINVLIHNFLLGTFHCIYIYSDITAIVRHSQINAHYLYCKRGLLSMDYVLITNSVSCVSH